MLPKTQHRLHSVLKKKEEGEIGPILIHLSLGGGLRGKTLIQTPQSVRVNSIAVWWCHSRGCKMLLLKGFPRSKKNK